MKSILLLMTLLGFSVAAHADWERMGSGTANPVLYKSAGNPERTGPDTFKLWHIVDYAADQDYEGKPFRSLKLNYEYDCSKRVLREWLRVLHKDGMGGGLTVYWTHGPWPWVKPEAGSVDEALLTSMCK